MKLSFFKKSGMSKVEDKDKKKKNHYNTKLCKSDMTFEQCELAILRNAVDINEVLGKKKILEDPDVSDILLIVETFLRNKKLICYGGTAINNILPKSEQFYDKDIELPDYDFYSSNALNDSIELADIYYKNGYVNVEAKSGVHFGTFKVYVNFLAIADITELKEEIMHSIKKDSITVNGIMYAPPNFLRMNMYLELSRPAGDVSRWEKVLKRLLLLNKEYPLKTLYDCSEVDFQRKMTDKVEDSEKIYSIVKDLLIDDEVVFFGGYASSLYGQYMPLHRRKLIEKIPDFDVLSMDPKKTAELIRDKLIENNFSDTKIIFYPSIDEIIPLHYEIRIGKESIVFIYQPIACHSYNTITIDQKDIKVATISTMLGFYLAFYFIKKPYYYQDRILCMAKFLFELEDKNRLNQDGLLNRFPETCYGIQMTKNDLKREKNDKYAELRDKVGTLEYNSWFLNYNPKKDSNKKKVIYNNTKKSRSIIHPFNNRFTYRNKSANINTSKYTKNTKKSKYTKKYKYIKYKSDNPNSSFSLPKEKGYTSTSSSIFSKILKTFD